MMIVINNHLITILFVILLVICNSVTIHAIEDSYLEAYQQSHNSLNKNVVNEKNDRDYNENQYPYPAPIAPQLNYQYGPPKPVYGPPLAPIPNYPPPLPPVYGPPAYQKPHGMLGLLDKLKWKIDLFTLGKILLKIVLFKKLISFIAIICLLLFIPTLKHKHHHHSNNHNNNNNNGGGINNDEADIGDDDDEDYDDGRKFMKKQFAGTLLDNLTASVIEAIERFNKAQREDEANKCEGIFCKVKKALEDITF